MVSRFRISHSTMLLERARAMELIIIFCVEAILARVSRSLVSRSPEVGMRAAATFRALDALRRMVEVLELVGWVVESKRRKENEAEQLGILLGKQRCFRGLKRVKTWGGENRTVGLQVQVTWPFFRIYFTCTYRQEFRFYRNHNPDRLSRRSNSSCSKRERSSSHHNQYSERINIHKPSIQILQCWNLITLLPTSAVIDQITIA